MKSNFNEIEVTNLGPIPEGLSFMEASKSVLNKRKYYIDPDNNSGRLTICETQREIFRLADKINDAELTKNFRILASLGYNYGKCMDARMKELKSIILTLDPDYEEK